MLESSLSEIFRRPHQSAFTCSKVTIGTLEQCQWRCSGIFIVNFEHNSHLTVVFLLLTFTCKCWLRGVPNNLWKKVSFEQGNVGWNILLMFKLKFLDTTQNLQTNFHMAKKSAPSIVSNSWHAWSWNLC